MCGDGCCVAGKALRRRRWFYLGLEGKSSKRGYKDKHFAGPMVERGRGIYFPASPASANSAAAMPSAISLPACER